jgi:hypothetical protein
VACWPWPGSGRPVERRPRRLGRRRVPDQLSASAPGHRSGSTSERCRRRRRLPARASWARRPGRGRGRCAPCRSLLARFPGSTEAQPPPAHLRPRPASGERQQLRRRGRICRSDGVEQRSDVRHGHPRRKGFRWSLVHERGPGLHCNFTGPSRPERPPLHEGALGPSRLAKQISSLATCGGNVHQKSCAYVKISQSSLDGTD